MLKNYLIVAIRNLLRNKVFSFINISGLALGMALSILMLTYVYYHFSFDDFYKDNERIYLTKINSETKGQDEDITAIATAGIGVSLKEEIADIEQVVRIKSARKEDVNYNNKNYTIEESIYADSTFFDIFSLKLISGNSKTALAKPFQIVLTEKKANNIFGKQDPIGKILLLNNQYKFTVSGIVQNIPENSHLQFDALTSFSSLEIMPNSYLGWDGGWSYRSYIKIKKNASIKSITSLMPDFMYKHINYKYNKVGSNLSLSFEPLKNIHLKSNITHEFNTAGNLKTIYILLGVALLVLVIAIINYINLSTARSMKRAKEVGVRKVLGANRKRLIKQFIGESLLISFSSLLIALIIVELFQAEFNSLLHSQLEVFGKENIFVLLMAIFIVFIISILASSFPAFYLSGFRPAQILSGKTKGLGGNPTFRNLLVFMQFFISVGLIVITLTSFKQINFVKNKDLGFNKEQILLVFMNSENAQKHLNILKNEFLKLPEVSGIAASNDVLGTGISSNGYLPEGFKNVMMFHVLDVDANYLSLMGIEIIKGESFSKNSKQDSTSFIINEALANKLNWEHPIGKYIGRNGKHRIIGVVKDFNFSPLNDKISPLIITTNPYGNFAILSLKLGAGNLEQTITKIQDKWIKVVNNETFDYRFLDNLIDRIFDAINNLQNTKLILDRDKYTRQKEIVDLNYQLDKYKTDFDRKKQLFEKKAIALKEYEDAKREYSFNVQQLKISMKLAHIDSVSYINRNSQIMSSISRMYENTKLLKKSMANLVVKSPASGKLSSFKVELGQTKSPSEHLGQIDKLTGKKLLVNIDERYTANVKNGQKAEYLSENNDKYKLSVSKIYTNVTNGSFQVEMLFDSIEPQHIKRGQNLQMRLILSEVNNAMMIKRDAFFATTGGNWIYVLNRDEKSATKRPIQIGKQNIYFYEILEGLKTGDKVIVSSYETFGDYTDLVFE
ncbi:MAG: hypothetical protein B6I20_05655 [Bacteroidetes bacterium 4572_117]|nr:MAG: hypothetical protein B6I20_05655 [Bacteroidetes bacterium 4572_117]